MIINISDLLSFYSIGVLSIVVISVVACFVALRYKISLPSWVFYVFIGLSAYILFAQYLKYQSLHFYVDFTQWIQLFHNIVHTGLPESLNQEFLRVGTLNYFSAHFVPFIYLLAVPFKLLPHGETVIFLNFFLMASSAIPLYKIASRSQGSKQFGLFMATLLLWYPTFQYITLYEFEMLRFSIPILLWMLYFWQEKRIRPYFLFAILAVLVREEVGLTVGMFGLYLFLFGKQKKIGLATLGIGFGAFFLIAGMIMPGLRTAGNFGYVGGGSFGQFGGTPLEVIKNVLLHPWLMFKEVFQLLKLSNIGMLFLPLLFISFFAPAVLISILANTGVGMISSSIEHSSYMLYYVSPSIPFIFYAFIKGWPKFLEKLKKITPSRYLNINAGSAAMIVVFSGLLVSNIFFGPSPISLQFWFKDIRPARFKTQNFHYSVYNITDHHRQAKEFRNLIPDSAIVSTQQFLFPMLFDRGAMMFPKLESVDNKFKADYVFIDKTNNGLKKESPAYITQAEFDIVEKDQEQWRLVTSAGNYFLYKRIP